MVMYVLKQNNTITFYQYDGVAFLLSGRRDSNPGPLAPKASALTGLRYAPKNK